MTTESKDTKKPRVSKEHEALLKTLDKLGVATTDAEGKELPYEILLTKVVTEFQKTNEQLTSALADSEADALNKYATAVDHHLKNHDFIKRLKNLNVPVFYLHLFRDDDIELEDRDLWGIVNASGINPYNKFQDLYAERRSFKLNKSKKPGRRR